MALKRQKSKPTHNHYVVTCGACAGQFPMCGLPCFIFCPLCQIKIIFREEEE